eukprot:CAMPEP_0168614098 /NCGR_PEP_ID=MMETSP0449_2-20121227/3795_1 /TAXON_ID=1082188 /ORGANISM="Strombidium rassoulzadegani, Strain ras09" /LENGTH=49 /DNA_ID= /DNA_START= /DNA_END= /DNA_ORIENTATION=
MTFLELLHNLELPVLVPLVLVDLLDGDLLIVLVDSGLEDNAEGAVSDDT